MPNNTLILDGDFESLACWHWLIMFGVGAFLSAWGMYLLVLGERMQLVGPEGCLEPRVLLRPWCREDHVLTLNTLNPTAARVVQSYVVKPMLCIADLTLPRNNPFTLGAALLLPPPLLAC